MTPLRACPLPSRSSPISKRAAVPAAQALKDWGLSHRFAGSGDRAAIAGLAYDALRRKLSSAWIMGADTPRAVLLGMLARERGFDVEAVARLADGARFAPGRCPTTSMRACARRASKTRRRMCAATIPNGSTTQLAATFGDERAGGGGGARRPARRSTCASTR